MAIAADLSESTYRRAETFLTTLDEDQACHVTAVGPYGHTAKPACEPCEVLIHAITYQQLHTRTGDAILGRFTALYPAAIFPAL